VIIGAAVLHDVTGERFERLTQRLHQLLTPHGYGVFLENSFFNPMFRLVRAVLPTCLRLGHNQEYPFDPKRYQILQRYFAFTRRDCIGVVLFHRFHAQLLSKLVDHLILSRSFDALDYWVTRCLPPAVALWLSYVQVVSFSKQADLDKLLNLSVVARPWIPVYRLLPFPLESDPA